MLFSEEFVVSREILPTGARVDAIFHASWPLLAGHFPDDPVVPAYALVGLARFAAELAAGEAVEIAAIDRAKVVRRVNPGERVACVVELERGEKLRARAQISAVGENAGSLVLTLVRPR